VGCLEQEVSEAALIRKSGGVHSGSITPFDDLVQRGEAGEPDANKLFDNAGTVLGLATSYLVNLLNPELIILAGPVGTSGFELIYPSFRTSLIRNAWRYSSAGLRIERSRLGDNAVSLGAAVAVAVGAAELEQD
jgi:predicted NBD/HSP70 family sugar kinase